jgi:hypothetical protein
VSAPTRAARQAPVARILGTNRESGSRRDGRGHRGIDLVGDHPLTPLHERRGELPAPGADLDHKIVGFQLGRVGDAAHRDRIGQEVLGERTPRAGVRM